MSIPGIGKSQEVTKLAYLSFQIFTSEYKLSAEQACGIMGNMWAESNFQPSVVEHGNGIGWGLFQLSFERRPPAEKWCDDHGYQEGNTAKKVGLQIKYVMEIEKPQWIENGQTMKAITGIKKRKTLESAVKGWLWCWERPGIPRESERMDFARTCLKAWKDKAGEGVEGLEGLSFGSGGDEGPDYVSFEEALIEGFKGGKKEKPAGIAIHEILGYTSAKAAKDALHKKQTIGQGGAQFHIVCDAKDAYMVVDLEKRVSHVQRTSGGKNLTGISNPDAKTISIGMCGSSGAVMGKAAQVAAEVCHLLDLDANTINGSFKFDGLKDPASWEAQENNSIIGPNGNFINMVMQQGAAAAGAADIGGINSSTGGGGGGGRGSTAKAIKVAEEWHAMNDKCFYSMAAARRKGPHTGGVDCSHFVMGCFAGAGYNVQIGSTVWMLQNCKPLEGEKNSDQCRGGKNAFFKQIPPNEARKGDVLVAGGLGGAGAGGHTGMVWEKYHGRETKFMNSGGCSAEGRAQPNLSSIGCAMGSMGLWVFMTVNSNDSDEPEEDEESTESKEKEKKNKVVKKK